MMVCLFGFMDWLIIGKWMTDWDTVMDKEKKQPPGVIMCMIVMFLSGGEYGEVKGGGMQWADLVPM